MLDVHVPHPTHTWTDFFIHIATIVIGLLIAIGLEQSVEAVHHYRQVAEAREALRQERSFNVDTFARCARRFKDETERFQSNLKTLLYIQQHTGVKTTDWPAPINWHYNSNSNFADSAWATIERSNVPELLPQREVRETDRLYKSLARVRNSSENRLAAIRAARTYMVADFDPAHLTAAQLEDAIQQAKTVLTFHYRLGADMRNHAATYQDFQPAPTTDDLTDIMHEPRPSEFRAPPNHPGSPGSSPAAAPPRMP